MKVYMDMNSNEIVSEEVARSRMCASITGDEIMHYIFDDVGWDELRKHLDDDFVIGLFNNLSNDWFSESFT